MTDQKPQKLLEQLEKNREKFKKFNPSDQAMPGKIFGMPHSKDDAMMHVFPINSAITVSGTEGAENGPDGLLEGSACIELFNKNYRRDAYLPGMYLLEKDNAIGDLHKKGRNIFLELIKTDLEIARTFDADKVNEFCELLNSRVENWIKKSLDDGHIVAAIGGCHGSIYGAVAAHAKKYKDFTLLMIDAHLDLRKAYEGVTYSHASVMWNILNNIPEVKHLVCVGIRSYGLDEYDFVRDNRNRVSVYYADDMQESQDKKSASWRDICQIIVNSIPTEDVYLSFDHDGFEVHLCSSTGTPVPGGLSMWQAKVLIETIAREKRIIGFDLNEMVPNTQVDRNSAAEIFYHMYYWTMVSRGVFPAEEVGKAPEKTGKVLTEKVDRVSLQ